MTTDGPTPDWDIEPRLAWLATLAEHKPQPTPGFSSLTCVICEQHWPCPDATDAARKIVLDNPVEWLRLQNGQPL